MKSSMISTQKLAGKFRRVLLVSLHYSPEPNFITADLAEYFSQNGHDITVITAHPSYPIGRFYNPKNSCFPKKSIENGVKIWRLPVIPNHTDSKYMRAAYYISFLIAAFMWSFFCGKKDLTIVYHAPFTTAMSVVWQRLLGTRIVFISPDLWPESFPASGIELPSWLYNAMYAYSKVINRFADRIITSTEGIKQRYMRDGIPEGKLDFCPVWVGGLPDTVAEGKPAEGAFSREIVYAGNLGPAQALHLILEAADQLREDTEVTFGIYGTGAAEDSLRSQAKAMGLKNVNFYGRVSPSEAYKKLNEAFAVILHLRRTALFRMTIPSKLASLLACSSLLICGAEGESNQIVESNKAGLIFEPENAADFLRVVKEIKNISRVERAEIISNAKRLYNRSFSKKVLLEKYYRIMTGNESV